MTVRSVTRFPMPIHNDALELSKYYKQYDLGWNESEYECAFWRNTSSSCEDSPASARSKYYNSTTAFSAKRALLFSHKKGSWHSQFCWCVYSTMHCYSREVVTNEQYGMVVLFMDLWRNMILVVFNS